MIDAHAEGQLKRARETRDVRQKLVDTQFYVTVVGIIDSMRVRQIDVAEVYGVSRETVRQWVKKGRAAVA